jgi:hypothetical protein
MNPERWRKVEEICHEALAREPAARDAYLEAACAGDGALRLEVASLIAEHPHSEAFLAASPLPAASVRFDQPAGLPTPPPEPPTPSLVGRTLSHYRIDGFLRAGGMGQVYRAWDTRSIATWRSRCSRPMLRRTPTTSRASSAKRERSPSSTTPTS